MSFIFGWWLFVVYYVWAAFIQESIEHNSKFDIYPILTSGKWHMVHHHHKNYNYGVFFPIWDIVFGTWKSHGDRK
jgi:sterol desaturase/sphingolipid hydroxylase (fatty acid hydroxylase superfamily)